MNVKMIRKIAIEEMSKREEQKQPISNSNKYYFSYLQYLKLRGDQE